VRFVEDWIEVGLPNAEVGPSFNGCPDVQLINVPSIYIETTRANILKYRMVDISAEIRQVW